MADATKKTATLAAYGRALVRLREANPDVVVLDADLSKSTERDEFAKRFPERFFEMGIAEADMIGTAAGLAASGKIPFASTFAVFASGRAFDQVRQVIAYPGLDVKIGASHRGITVGEDGASHQSVEDLALMRAIPGMTVIVPVDAIQTEKAVVVAARETGAIVTAEEHSVIGGLGSAVCEITAKRRPVPVERIGVQDVFGQSGTPDEVLRVYGLLPGDIADAATRVIARKP